MRTPSEECFRESMKAMDVRITDTIVCYDSIGMMAAPRVSWMLRAFGAKKVFVLNGTFNKWVS
jgi:thiosulfate/3-mercaptopyruvate sulfurtransferase